MPKRRLHTAAERPAPVFVDSGAWIAFFSLRDGRHADADGLIREAVSRRVQLITTNLVLAEVHRQLLFRAGIQAALGTLERIEKSDRLTIEFVTVEHHRGACEWLRRFEDQAFAYTDAASFAVMKARRCQAVIGFDHHFTVAGFRRWQPPK